MARTLLVSELLPPAVETGTLAERDRLDYEAALEAFLDDRWQDARRLLRRLPSDGPSKLLRRYMKRQGYRVPDNWDGVIVMKTK